MIDLENDPGSGRPSAALHHETVSKIHELVDNEPRITPKLTNQLHINRKNEMSDPLQRSGKTGAHSTKIVKRLRSNRGLVSAGHLTHRTSPQSTCPIPRSQNRPQRKTISEFKKKKNQEECKH